MGALGVSGRVLPPIIDASQGRRGGAAESDHWVFWGLPIALIAVAVLVLPSVLSLVYWLLGLIADGCGLGIEHERHLLYG